MPRNVTRWLTANKPIAARDFPSSGDVTGSERGWFVDRKKAWSGSDYRLPGLNYSDLTYGEGPFCSFDRRSVDLNYAVYDRPAAKMQWRSIVVGLVLLRLSLSCFVWLAFGLGPSVSWGFNFPLGFNLGKLELLFRDGKAPSLRSSSWSRIHGHRYEETICTRVEEESPKGSYLSFFDGNRDEYERRYGSFPETLRVKMKDMAKEMFYFGYDNYMKYAFPEDELNPIDCEGRGPDVSNP